jgi:hypothetical protein
MLSMLRHYLVTLDQQCSQCCAITSLLSASNALNAAPPLRKVFGLGQQCSECCAAEVFGLGQQCSECCAATS